MNESSVLSSFLFPLLQVPLEFQYYHICTLMLHSIHTLSVLYLLILLQGRCEHFGAKLYIDVEARKYKSFLNKGIIWGVLLKQNLFTFLCTIGGLSSNYQTQIHILFQKTPLLQATKISFLPSQYC